MKQNLLLLLVVFTFAGISAQTTLLDFEAPGTSTTYQYFGSTLDGTLNNIIANPDASGINTSSMVADHVKPAAAMTWAGAFAAPALQTAADMIVNSQVCVKVWFNAPGNVGIKLEASSSGGPVWVRTVDVTESQQWTEVCIDVSLPSIEAPFQAAAGHKYDGVTLFFDFGVSPTVDRTYYWDDLVTKSGGGPMEGDVTFSVDMNSYTGPFTTVYVSGTFNGWSGDSNALEDDDLDGVWTGTLVDIPVGAHEFKFTLDNWTAQELFSPYTPCVITTVNNDGTFVNRRLAVSGDAALPTYCFNSCFACGDGVNITFQVGAGNIAASPDGLYIAGGGNFGNPGDYPLNDDDNDGVWVITVERQKGFESFFTFTNGNCPDYSCKENIEGLSCANPDNFNDRKIGPVDSDMTLATCFGECTDNFDDCSGVLSPANVTFKVDMNDYTGTFTTPYIAGSMNGWAGDANPMTDANNDGIWETTLQLGPGTYEYKFPLDNWNEDEVFTKGDPCTISINSGEFINRIITVDGDATVCFLWATCTECEAVGTRDLTIDNNFFSLQPNLVDQFTTISFDQPSFDERLMRVFNTTGKLVLEQKIDGATTNFKLNTSHFQKGIYLVNVLDGETLGTQKMVKL